MKNKTAEEVYVEMLKPAETVTLKVQHRPDEFSMLKDVPGDGFYIRYMRIYTCTQKIVLLGVKMLQLCKRTPSSLLDMLETFSSNQLCPRFTV